MLLFIEPCACGTWWRGAPSACLLRNHLYPFRRLQCSPRASIEEAISLLDCQVASHLSPAPLPESGERDAIDL